MIKFAFSVRDRATISFLDPFFVNHKGMAERMFADAVNDPATPLNKHPEDYDLYELGTFDDGTGLFEKCVPQQISAGKSVYKSKTVPHLPLPFTHEQGVREAGEYLKSLE